MKLIAGVIFLFSFVVILPDSFAKITRDPRTHTYINSGAHFMYECKCSIKCGSVGISQVLLNNEGHGQPYYEQSCGDGTCKCTRSFITFGTPQACTPCNPSSSTRRKRSVRGHDRGRGRGHGRRSGGGRGSGRKGHGHRNHLHEKLEDLPQEGTGTFISPAIQVHKCKCDDTCLERESTLFLNHFLDNVTFDKGTLTIDCLTAKPPNSGKCVCYIEMIKRQDFGCNCQGVLINPALGA